MARTENEGGVTRGYGTVADFTPVSDAFSGFSFDGLDPQEDKTLKAKFTLLANTKTQLRHGIDSDLFGIDNTMQVLHPSVDTILPVARKIHQLGSDKLYPDSEESEGLRKSNLDSTTPGSTAFGISAEAVMQLAQDPSDAAWTTQVPEMNFKDGVLTIGPEGVYFDQEDPSDYITSLEFTFQPMLDVLKGEHH